MRSTKTIVAAAALCCAAAAFASGNSVFTGDGLDGYSTYDAWKAAQDGAKSSSSVGVAETFEPGGFQTGVSTTAISLEARFRTWLESAGRALRSDAFRGLMIIFQ